MKTATALLSVLLMTVGGGSMSARTVKKAVRKAGTITRTKSGRSRRVTRRYVAETPPRSRVQGEPTPDRYREIQGALATKGYLKSEPSGAWDAESQEAMRRYQEDNRLEATGKINSRSLIGLGLGGPSQEQH